LVTCRCIKHPLASHKGVIPQSNAAGTVQLVLNRSIDIDERARHYGRVSRECCGDSPIWGARHAFLRAGFGFGNMPPVHGGGRHQRAASWRIVRIEIPGKAKLLDAECVRCIARTHRPDPQAAG